MAKKATIEDIRSTCDCATIKYCPLEKLLEYMADRLAEQYKCIDVLKDKQSRKAGKDIGWHKACEIWVEEGYAKAFADVWRDNMTHKKLCQGIRKKLNKGDDCL